MPKKQSPALANARIQKTDIIAEVIAAFPPAISTFMAYGLHCVGCSANTADTIELGARSHGIDDATIEAMVKEVNEQADAFQLTLLDGGGVWITPAAEEAILAVAAVEKKEGQPLRVEVTGGGCAGFGYALDFDTQHPGDTVWTFPRVTLIASPEHAAKFQGSTIDYLDGALGTGFKIDNPNPTGCTCGTHDGHRASPPANP